MSHITTSPGAYGDHDREVGRRKYTTDLTFLRSIILRNLRALRRSENTATRDLRLDRFKMFGLQNREVTPLISSKNMVTFHKKRKVQTAVKNVR